ncbi:MAG: MAPEG family protein [Colwellia sp.]|nr:MAPEG family protein [Colwellia sp.]
MELTIIIILLALLQYIAFIFKVGFSRPKLEVPAPKITGNETWERMFRVQQNTLEQLMIFIPSLLIFGHYVSTIWVAVPGVIFLIARQIYAVTYVKNPESRALGFALTIFTNIGLVLTSLSSIVYNLMT